MTTSMMVNFRTKPEGLKAIDEAAQYAGLSRSNFLRLAAEQLVERTLASPRPRIGTDTAKKDHVEEPSAQLISQDECDHPAEEMVMLPNRVKLCRKCGAKIA